MIPKSLKTLLQLATAEDRLDARIELAKLASRKAYCPYSKFAVGAVIVTDKGQEFFGCNVENASYGLSMCAERNAILRMIADGERRISVVIIYTATLKPAAPCGACRQVIHEFGSQSRIISVCDGDECLDSPLDQLLPSAFGPSNLD